MSSKSQSLTQISLFVVSDVNYSVSISFVSTKLIESSMVLQFFYCFVINTQIGTIRMKAPSMYKMAGSLENQLFDLLALLKGTFDVTHDRHVAFCIITYDDYVIMASYYF